jgi:hypothetical protein
MKVTDLSLSYPANQELAPSVTDTSSYLQHQHSLHAESSMVVIYDFVLVKAVILEFDVASFPACLGQTDLCFLGMLSASPHDATSHLQPLVSQS